MDLTHRIIALKPFKFVVGKEEKDIYLQSALVAKWSKVLDKMMNSPFIEGQGGYAVLADEDVETIAAFPEFVYTGDYHLLTDESPTDSETESHDTGDCQDNDMEFGAIADQTCSKNDELSETDVEDMMATHDYQSWHGMDVILAAVAAAQGQRHGTEILR
ncbi:hypothetical protein E4U61_005330 [Claviceps capensis]|nr:hypothetical protein E4U61_005330 [Claviceps capensis]